MFIGAIFFLSKMDFYDLLRKTFIKSNTPFLFALAAPVIAIAISQSIRNNFYPNNWDAPMRMFLCIPIYIAISQGWLLSSRNKTITLVWIKWSMPIALITTLISTIYLPATNWGNYRTTYFVDPLSFCSYTLLFSFLVVIGLINSFKEEGFIYKLFCVASISIGLYLSITSGARTGWLNLPLFIVVMWFYSLGHLCKKQQLFMILFFLGGLATLMSFNSELVNKFYIGAQEFVNYKMNELNQETSVAMRLSFYRMGIEYFIAQPFAGWGDLAWSKVVRDEFLIFASEETLLAPKHGFHNEIITNSVRSGIWGLISVLSLYFAATFNAVKGLYMELGGRHKLISVIILILISHLILAGLVTETTNLTFLSAFIGVLLSVLLGEQKLLENNRKLV